MVTIIHHPFPFSLILYPHPVLQPLSLNKVYIPNLRLLQYLKPLKILVGWVLVVCGGSFLSEFIVHFPASEVNKSVYTKKHAKNKGNHNFTGAMETP